MIYESEERRQFLAGLLGMSTLAMGGIGTTVFAQTKNLSSKILTKNIPASGEAIPVIGMGTWITFNVGSNIELRNARTEVLQEFFRLGGGMVDCSPMYGSAAEVLGYSLQRINNTSSLFSASKVWTSWTNTGPKQMAEQKQHWGIPKFDLMQIHNLVNWENHLETLKADKAAGKIRYIGITTSHGRRHEELETIMRKHKLDFVQLTYNVLDREVESRILPLAKEKGIAVIANRPYQGGSLFRMFEGKALPNWAKAEADVSNWAEFFLKFIVSHPAITCAIPATSKVEHMRENMNAAYGRLPDEATRLMMANYIQSI